MFDSLKLSTSSMILIGLFVLILVIALLGYMETSKIQSRLEKISYQMTKQQDKCRALSVPIASSNSSNQSRDSVERFMQRQQEEQPDEQDEQEEQPDEEQEEQEEQNNNVHLSESQQEFSSEVPEAQSAFSLGAIFNNLDPSGTDQIEELDDDELDKIASDSEYSDEDDYSSGSGSEEQEDPKLKKELEKNLKKYSEQDIELLSLVNLRELCIDNKISKHGNKQALINKLLKL
jgi:hypothetical protein